MMALQDMLSSIFRYDPQTGKLFNRVRRAPNSLAGQEAGFDNGNGYRRVTLPSRKKLYTHQVIWALVNGEVPTEEIDHIDGDTTNNRIGNLRLATRYGNTQNTGKRSHSNQPYKGVRRTREGKWAARITAAKKHHHIGTFSTPEEAYVAYCQASGKLHGDFARVI